MGKTMMGAMITLGIAICGSSLIWLLLIKRAQKRGGNRRSSCSGSGSDGGNYAGDAGGLFDWGGHHSASDHSAGSADGGSWGDSGGSDGGGGGDGSGGGD